MRLLILTNNRHVVEREEATSPPTTYVEGTPIQVLEQAIEMLQKGYRLVSAPLPPNIPMMRAPFRSLILEACDAQYDIDGIEAVEKARRTMARQRGIGSAAADGVENAADFAKIDEEYLLRALRDYRIIKAEEAGAP